jgi:hypothetical protein
MLCFSNSAFYQITTAFTALSVKSWLMGLEGHGSSIVHEFNLQYDTKTKTKQKSHALAKVLLMD